MTFTAEEIAYLRSQPLARIATVGPDGQPDASPVGFEFDGTYFYVGGHDPAKTRKYRNVRAGRRSVALVIDDLVATDPWTPRFLRIYGIAEPIERDGMFGVGPYLRITPTTSWSWNLQGRGLTGEDEPDWFRPRRTVHAAGARHELGDRFRRPKRADRPLIYLFPPEVSAIDATELERAIGQIAEAGIGGVNLFDLDLATTVGQNGLLITGLEAARRYGITADLTIHNMARWPQVEVDGGADQQELVYGTTAPPPGAYRGPVPGPAQPAERPETLVAVVAARRVAGSDDTTGTLLDPDSLLDLTDTVAEDQLTWTVPDDGDWLLFGIWRRPTESAHPDYLSVEGTRAMTDYWDEHVFTPRVRELVDEVADTLFEDSLHLQGYQVWTRNLLSEFERRRGYSLRPFLPILFIPHLNDWATNTFLSPQTRSTSTPADFDFPGDRGVRIRNDYYQTLSELYQEHHLEALNAWARGHGLRYRPKPAYNASLDIAAAAVVDVPDTENFAMGNTLDGIRGIAGAAHLGGKERLVVEVSPTTTSVGYDLYSTTWREALAAIHETFAAGANHVELHGFAYPDGPGSFGPQSDGTTATWPGFWQYRGPSAPDVVGPLGLAEAYGPRMPYWRHATDVTTALAREQLVLRQGRPRVDVAVYRHSFWNHGFPYTSNHRNEERFSWFGDRGLERAGYTYDFVGPALLERTEPGVTDGRLADDGPGYRALILHNGQRDGVDGMSLATARRILGYATAGLGVVVIGEPPAGTGFHADAADDAAVREAMEELLRTSGVVRVASEADVPRALERLGILPDFRPAEPANVLGVHRETEDADFYFLHNRAAVNNLTGAFDPEPAKVELPASLRGDGRPYLLDAWTGELTPVASYRRDVDGRITVPLVLAPGESTMIALFRSEPHGPHVRSTTADGAVSDRDGRPLVRSARAGRFEVELDDGRSGYAEVGPLPVARRLDEWRLNVQDWRPGAGPSETLVREHELRLDTLRPWLEIPELADVSGIGTYRTRVELGPEWSSDHVQAWLNLGNVSDSIRLRVDDRPVPPFDPSTGWVNLTGFLSIGDNVLEVEVATTLRNRLRTLPEYPEFAAEAPRPYGLVGPVELVGYGLAAVRSDDRRSTG